MNQNEFLDSVDFKYEFKLPEIEIFRAKELEELDVIEVVNKTIEDAAKANASDIHIEPRINEKIYIRFRIEGDMVEYGSLPGNYRESIISRIKILASMDISEKRKPQDGKLTIPATESHGQINLRVVTFPTNGGLEDMVMRLLPNEKPLPLDRIGLHPKNLKISVDTINKPYGMIFVCGPTGSGKTTTLHSMLNYLNTSKTKIWTAEDPIEITQKGLRQVQVAKYLDYATILRSFLRGDPDVIMIGEIRDEESAHIAIEAALTGHLVLTTLHTNSSVESIRRVINMGISPYAFADATLGVLAQRLCRTLCTRCKDSYYPDKEEITQLIKLFCNEIKTTDFFLQNPDQFAKGLYEKWVKEYGDNGQIKLYRPRGCHRCVGGYRGRIGVHELMINSPTIKRAIIARKPTDDLLAIALNEGMFTLRMDGILKVLSGATDMAQLETVCN